MPEHQRPAGWPTCAACKGDLTKTTVAGEVWCETCTRRESVAFGVLASQKSKLLLRARAYETREAIYRDALKTVGSPEALLALRAADQVRLEPEPVQIVAKAAPEEGAAAGAELRSVTYSPFVPDVNDLKGQLFALAHTFCPVVVRPPELLSYPVGKTAAELLGGCTICFTDVGGRLRARLAVTVNTVLDHMSLRIEEVGS